MSGSCNICSRCQSCQSFCMVGNQMATSHGAQLLPDVQRDDIIIKKINPAVLKAIADSITAAASKGSEQNSSPTTLAQITEEFMYATDINAFLAHITHGLLTTSGKPGNVARDDIVYASFFQQINAAISNLKVYYYACDKCNTQCDSCVSCQHSSCHSSG